MKVDKHLHVDRMKSTQEEIKDATDEYMGGWLFLKDTDGMGEEEVNMRFTLSLSENTHERDIQL